ncbi:MAG: TrpB-like pyridoxal phosphate-dependent enzyme [Ruminiclostridium sp.]
MAHEISVPKSWYDIEFDQNIKIEPLIFENDYSNIYPEKILEKNKSAFISIPKPVLDIYEEYRPTPLRRAINLEKYLNTSCKIYYKYEGQNPVGSHKLNTAIPQAYYTKLSGFDEITTATGAGQWGSAVAYAASRFGLKCTIFFVAVSLSQKPYRKVMMEMLGAEVFSSPSNKTKIGLEKVNDPKYVNGNMGLATSEAIEYAVTRKATFGETSHARGVILHQTVIGLESIEQMKLYEDYPDVVIGCVGGGTNFGGISTPFLKYRMEQKENTRFVAVEPAANPKLTKGEYRYDYADSGKLTPQIKMYTLGHEHSPDPIHAGGLRYHGFDPILSKLYSQNYIEAQSYDQKQIFEAGTLFYKTEGILPAPESAHAVRAAIYEAQRAENKNRSILFCMSGHGYLDLAGYEFYLKNLKDNSLEK